MIVSQCLKPWRRRELKWIFDNWMANTALLCAQMDMRTHEWYDEPFRPFHDTENSGVSILLAGAAKAGYLPISEYAIEKVRDNEVFQGRADLWFIVNNLALSFEFKRAWNRSTSVNLESVMASADKAIRQIQEEEYNHAFSATIAPYFEDRTDIKVLEDYSKIADCCYTIGHSDKYKTYFYFNRCEPE